MTELNPVFEALANSLINIIYLISKFDIMAINPQRLAMIGQLFADFGRVVVDVVKIIVSIIQTVKGA